MMLQSETLYVYTAVIRDMMDKSNATYVTIYTINTTTTTTNGKMCRPPSQSLAPASIHPAYSLVYTLTTPSLLRTIG
jgi:hypothetical protein